MVSVDALKVTIIMRWNNKSHSSETRLYILLNKKIIMKKQKAIWLDFKEAFVITIDEERKDVEHILSEIEHYHIKGGARSKTPYGPMDKVSESKYLERKKHQANNFYKRVMESTSDADEILIMGPAEAKFGLRDAIGKSNAFAPTLLGFETVDSISMNQKIEKARKFFGDYCSTKDLV